MPEDPFELFADDYDAWYDRHAHAYRSELRAIRRVIGSSGRALEVGVGTGRFAGPLGLRFGLDPAFAMLRRARERGLSVVGGVGERLPFRARSFDRVLIALTLCYFDAPDAALHEARRVLRPAGRLVIGFLDPTSPPGRRYRKGRRGRFYEEAEFRGPAEVEQLLDAAGFRPARWAQTLFRRPEELGAPERPRPGSGSGIFVVVEARVRDGGG
ncbi:MAG: class I SAM-dependent methyltransferase [Gemmatimonadota bacterium]